MTKVSQIILGSIITIASLVVPVPEVKADTHEEHRELWSALQEVGIDTRVNLAGLCDDGDTDGAYFYMRSTLVVCQDNANTFGAKEVGWTPNDYDTLRHEAHHVVQDCLAGGLADGKSTLLFNDFDELKEFVYGILTEEQVNSIITGYREDGAPDDVILRELEAFAVASGVSASSITTAVTEVCGV